MVVCFLRKPLCLSYNILFLFKKLSNFVFIIFSTIFENGKSNEVGNLQTIKYIIYDNYPGKNCKILSVVPISEAATKCKG